jgi:hypothetical protein
MPDKNWSESQALTRAAPTLVSEGLSLVRCKGFRVYVQAEATRTLSGAGALRAYLWNGSGWIRNTELDIELSADQAGIRTAVFPDQEVVVPRGRVLYAADGVTVSAGTTVTVTIEAF